MSDHDDPIQNIQPPKTPPSKDPDEKTKAESDYSGQPKPLNPTQREYQANQQHLSSKSEQIRCLEEEKSGLQQRLDRMTEALREETKRGSILEVRCAKLEEVGYAITKDSTLNSLLTIIGTIVLGIAGAAPLPDWTKWLFVGIGGTSLTISLAITRMSSTHWHSRTSPP